MEAPKPPTTNPDTLRRIANLTGEPITVADQENAFKAYQDKVEAFGFQAALEGANGRVGQRVRDFVQAKYPRDSEKAMEVLSAILSGQSGFRIALMEDLSGTTSVLPRGAKLLQPDEEVPAGARSVRECSDVLQEMQRHALRETHRQIDPLTGRRLLDGDPRIKAAGELLARIEKAEAKYRATPEFQSAAQGEYLSQYPGMTPEVQAALVNTMAKASQDDLAKTTIVVRQGPPLVRVDAQGFKRSEPAFFTEVITWPNPVPADASRSASLAQVKDFVARGAEIRAQHGLNAMTSRMLAAKDPGGVTAYPENSDHIGQPNE